MPWLLGGVSAGMGVIWHALAASRPTEASASTPPKETFNWSVLRQRVVLACIGLHCTTNNITYSVLQWSPTIYANLGCTPLQAGTYLAVPGMFGFCVNWVVAAVETKLMLMGVKDKAVRRWAALAACTWQAVSVTLFGLANTALNQLVARPEKLVVGQRYEREYFDPMQQQMSTISYRYLEEREIDLYDTKRLAYHFEQEIMGEELDVYVSPDGEILIQEFPMRTVASLLPEELGKTHVSGLKRDLRLRERTSKSKNDASKQDGAPIVDPSIDPNKLGLQGALQSLSSMIAPRPDASPDEPDMAVDMTRDPPDAAPDGDASAPPSP